MAGPPAAAPDAQALDSQLNDEENLVDYAYGRALEYAAALRFVGLLAGVGDGKDVEDARNTVMEVVKSVLTPGEMAPINEQMMKGSKELKQAEYEYGEAVRAINEGDNSPEAALRAEAARQRFLGAEQTLKPIAKDYHNQPWFYERWWKSAWSSIAAIYDGAIAAINNGTWKIAVCKAAIDVGFSVVETAILAGLVAFTGGVAAALIKIGKTAVAAAGKFTGAVRITISAERQLKRADGLLAVGGKVENNINFRYIHPEKEAVGAEKKLLGAENQGTTKATTDAGETSTKGNAATPPKSWKPKEVLGRRVYQRNDLIDPKRVDPDSGLTNLELMRNGRAPIGPDGFPVELHHMVQQEGLPFNNAMAPLAEVSKTFHSKNYNQIHIYPRGDPNYISWRKTNPANARRYDRYREAYWAQRAGDFIPD
jgi:A nuclease of the HNH/ENDO VII superfamily with conserved LHH